jgi:mono/diheme cytochrome c family protein
MTPRPLHLLLPLLLLAAACDRGTAEEERRGHDAPEVPPLDAQVLAALPEGTPAGTAERGAEHFARTCAVCHGPDAGGTQLAPALVGREWTRVEAQLGPLVELIRSGTSQGGDYPVPMPPRGGGEFDDEQIQAVAVYTLALHGASPRDARPAQMDTVAAPPPE